MTQEQTDALALVDDAIAQLALNRADHARLIRAVQVLRDGLTPEAEPEED